MLLAALLQALRNANAALEEAASDHFARATPETDAVLSVELANVRAAVERLQAAHSPPPSEPTP